MHQWWSVFFFLCHFPSKHLGTYDFCNHQLADRIATFGDKNNAAKHVPNDASMSKQLPVLLAKSAKTQRNSLLNPKNRAEQFPGEFCVSCYMVFCKLCQHNVDRKRVDTLCAKKYIIWRMRYFLLEANLYASVNVS